MNYKLSRKRGFTLIELLISITIIGILSAIAIPRLVNVVPQARDAKRLAAVNEFVAAIESYNLENGNYPDSNFCFSTTTGETTVNTGDVPYTVANFTTDYYKGQPPELAAVSGEGITCADGIRYVSGGSDGYTVSIPLERDQQANSSSPTEINTEGTLLYKVIVR